MTIARERALTNAWVEVATWAALWPISFFTAWVLLDCPAGRPHHPSRKHRHHDLAVPDPIAHAGEQDLFA